MNRGNDTTKPGKKLTAYKSNVLVEAGNAPSDSPVIDFAFPKAKDKTLAIWTPPNFSHYRAMLILMAKLDQQRKSGNNLDTIELSFDEYFSILGLPRRNTKRLLEKIWGCLGDRIVFMYNGNLALANIYEIFYIDEKNEKISVRFTSVLSDQISELSRCFTVIPIECVVNLSSVGAIRLYELCRQVANTTHKSRKFEDISQLARTLFLEATPDDWYTFLSKYIAKYIKQINEGTDLTISYTTIKEGRAHKTTGVVFNVEKKQKPQEITDESKNSLFYKDYLARLKLALLPANFSSDECERIAEFAYSFIESKENASDFVSNFMEENISLVVESAQKWSKNKDNIQNKIPWIMAIIENFYS